MNVVGFMIQQFVEKDYGLPGHNAVQTDMYRFHRPFSTSVSLPDKPTSMDTHPLSYYYGTVRCSASTTEVSTVAAYHYDCDEIRNKRTMAYFMAQCRHFLE